MITRIDNENHFISAFDPDTGFYFRTGVIKDGKETEQDPFMSSYPELLDIGIMGHCIHGKKGLCLKAGVECYQDGLHSQKQNMSLEDFKEIVDQVKGKTYQIALGGCGDPDQHEDFEEILKTCKDNGIVVNFTTSGLGMTPEKAKLCKKYCGAVAVSWYRSQYTLNAIDMLLKAGVKTNIHYVLSSSSLEEAIFHLKNDTFPKGINAVIFLLHKPVGLGSQEEVISLDHPLLEEFLTLVDKEDFSFKIGFDSCTVPALIRSSSTINPNSIDSCEGARWSAYITPDMKMLPCSFDNQTQKWQVDLKKYSIKEAWDSSVFRDFRNHFLSSCPECQQRALCYGSCPIIPEIVLCQEKQDK